MSSTNYGYALYYPYLHIKNDNWLKTAALYYNELYRIVPPSFKPNDNNIVCKLNEEFKFINNVDPTPAAKEIGKEFADYAKNELSDHQKRVEIRNKISPKLPMDSSFGLLDEKITHYLKKILPNLGLAKLSNSNEVIELEPVTGALYMTCLANKMAEYKKVPIVSDDPIYEPFIKHFQFEQNYTKNQDVAYSLGSLVIETAIPADIKSVKIKNILKFRKKYDDERRAFYDKINDIGEDIPYIEDENSFKKCLEHHQNRIEREVKVLKNGLKDVEISATTGFIGLSIPSTASLISEIVPDQAPLIASAGLLTIGTLSAITSGRKYLRSKRNSPWSYILSLESRLDSKKYIKNILTNLIHR